MNFDNHLNVEQDMEADTCNGSHNEQILEMVVSLNDKNGIIYFLIKLQQVVKHNSKVT